MDKPDSPLWSAERSGDEPFQIEFEGRAMPARQGDTVASALIAAGVQVLSRSLKFHRPRTVFCLSGSCGSCLLRIDGRPNTRSCQVRAEPGLRCARQMPGRRRTTICSRLLMRCFRSAWTITPCLRRRDR